MLPRSSAGPSGPGSVLDGPPPHPQLQSPLSAAMRPGTAPARSLPPEVISGLLATGQSVKDMLDTMASVAPDIAPEFAGAAELLLRGLAKLMTAGGGLTSMVPPTSPIPGATPGIA